jgi:type II secretory pathway pseudopilin PulG
MPPAFCAEITGSERRHYALKKMNHRTKKIRLRSGLTLLELVIAMAMITIIFAAVLPQFAAIRNSWDSKQGIAEALQNGRVLMDHINRNLSKAAKITNVSASSQTNGYIEFANVVGDVNRYDIHSTNNYVEFGPQPGTLSDLAGPVSLLRFTCYSACDLNTPITDPNIRVVKVDATFTNSSGLGQAKTFTTWAYLHGNGNNQVGLVNKTPFEFDTTDGRYSALSQIDSTHYLCAYDRSGLGDAVVLAVNPSTWAVTTPAARFVFDATSGTYPALSQIDSTHYLCAYDSSGQAML